MTATPGFGTGLLAVWRGAQLLRRPAIRPYVLAPLAVNVGVFLIGTVLLYRFLAGLVAQWLPPELAWLGYVLLPLIALAVMLAGFFSFSLVANLLATPFNGALSSAILRELRGASEAAPVPGLMEELRLGLAGELGKSLYLLKLTLPALLVLVVPVLNALGALVWGLLGAWALSLEYLDCVLGNQVRPFPVALKVARNHRGMALGLGSGLALLTALPLLNFLAMPIGVAAATLLYDEYLRGLPPGR